MSDSKIKDLFVLGKILFDNANICLACSYNPKTCCAVKICDTAIRQIVRGIKAIGAADNGDFISRNARGQTFNA